MEHFFDNLGYGLLLEESAIGAEFEQREPRHYLHPIVREALRYAGAAEVPADAVNITFPPVGERNVDAHLLTD
jgi:hypothetical protein